MIPSTEAIEEEAENVTRMGGGMFKRNSNFEDEDDQKKNPPGLYQDTKSSGFVLQDSLSTKILSGTS
jgi:hypothetical protein